MNEILGDILVKILFIFEIKEKKGFVFDFFLGLIDSCIVIRLP
jgi:hypothetical protein